MAEEINAAPLLKEIDTLMKSVEDFSTYLKKSESILSGKREELKSWQVFISKIGNGVLDLYRLAESMLNPGKARMFDLILTGFTMKMQESLGKFKEIDKELQVKEEILEIKLKKVEKSRKEILKKVSKADKWKAILHDVKKKTESGVLAFPKTRNKTREAADLLKGWFQFEKSATNFINDMAVTFELTSLLQVDDEFLEFENKYMRLKDESWEQIMDGLNGLRMLFQSDLGLEPQDIKPLKRRTQDLTSFPDLSIENNKLKDSFEKLEEWEFRRLNNKLTKKKEKVKLLQIKHEELLTESAKNKEEIAKRDELFREKDQEIEELRRELEKYRELKNAQEQTEAKLVKLEEMQEFNVTIIQEKDMRIEKLQGFTREIDGTLNKISELNNNQDDDLQMKVEDGLEDGKEYMKEASSLEDKITRKSQSSLREVSEYHSVNGKHNFGSLLANYEEDSERKFASKDLKNGKENVKEVFS